MTKKKKKARPPLSPGFGLGAAPGFHLQQGMLSSKLILGTVEW